MTRKPPVEGQTAIQNRIAAFVRSVRSKRQAMRLVKMPKRVRQTVNPPFSGRNGLTKWIKSKPTVEVRVCVGYRVRGKLVVRTKKNARFGPYWLKSRRLINTFFDLCETQALQL
ncbi:hypothetical protein [uncultured Desulfosarcina sp.]|uniref:hypothetical protein n=1 Tax=uncultured Desulfosarcina sp. TaxID=218289 RepID=UPI0029C7FE4B|nr:hypothetical protein [uncultured Desulfosarcina sp.]